jgi:hypothetical protein
MQDAADEDANALLGSFAQQFAKAPLVEERMKRERAATMSDAERMRRRRAPPKVQLGVRIRADARDLVDELVDHLGKNIGEIVELAIHALAKATPGLKGEGR